MESFQNSPEKISAPVVSEKIPKNVFLLSQEKVAELQKETRPKDPHFLIIECRHPDTQYTHQRGQASLRDIDITSEGERQAEISAANIASVLNPQKDIVVIHTTLMARTRDMGAIIKNKLISAGFKVLNPKEKYCGPNNTGRNNVYLQDDFGNPIDPSDFAYPRYFRAAEKGQRQAATEQGLDPIQYWTRGGNSPYIESMRDINQRAEKQFGVYLEAAEEYQPELEGKRLVIIQPAHIESLNDLWEKASGEEYTEKKSTGPIKGEIGLFILPNKPEINSIEVNGFFPYRDEKKWKFGYNKKESRYI